MKPKLLLLGALSAIIPLLLGANGSQPAPQFASPNAIPWTLVQRDTNAFFTAAAIDAGSLLAGSITAVSVDAGVVTGSAIFTNAIYLDGGTGSNAKVYLDNSNEVLLSSLGPTVTTTYFYGNSIYLDAGGTTGATTIQNYAGYTGITEPPGYKLVLNSNFSAQGSSQDYGASTAAYYTVTEGASPITFTGNGTNVGFNFVPSGSGSFNVSGAVGGNSYAAAGTAFAQFSCTSAATCNFASASGQTAAVDTGGGTSTASLGATNATTTNVGRSGQTTNINGNTTFSGTVVSSNTGNQFTCSSATPCNFLSASAQPVNIDTGGGSATANFGTNNATTTNIGRTGQTTNINGNVTFGGSITTPAWTACSLSSPWGNSSGNAACAYTKAADGKICTKGDVTPSSAASNGSAIFTLPSGYRPTEIRQFTGYVYISGTGPAAGFWNIQTTGAVTFQGYTGSTSLAAGNQLNIEACFYP